MKRKKQLNKLKKIDTKIKRKDFLMMKKRIKNSSCFSNVKEIDDEGLATSIVSEVAEDIMDDAIDAKEGCPVDAIKEDIEEEK